MIFTHPRHPTPRRPTPSRSWPRPRSVRGLHLAGAAGPSPHTSYGRSRHVEVTGGILVHVVAKAFE